MLINNIPFETDLLTILTELRAQLVMNGVNLLETIKDTPDNVMVSCPYHKGGHERKPSAGIKKSDGTFHCFTCGETHSLQEVISYCFGRTDDIVGAFGWTWLLKNFVTVSIEERKLIDLDYRRTTNADNVGTNHPVFISEEELDKYREYHPYMWKRKMTPDVVEIFDVGFDKANRCLTFPVRDICGNTLFIARRSVDTKFFNYPSGVEKPVYGLYEYHRHNTPRHKPEWDADEVIICESMIDCITCWVYGKYAVALNGLGTKGQFNQLMAMPNRKFILATDMDAAGQRARRRIRAGISKRKIVTEYVWDEHMAKDINDMSYDQFKNLKEIM